MHVSRVRVRWAAALAGMAAMLPAVPAAAEPAPREPIGAYLLMMVPNDGPISAATLWCGPAGGTHVSASRACDQLASASGEVRRIPARTGPCTLALAPVRVTADGTWRGRPRHFARTYPNKCIASRDTGGILF
ncbi:SSI family serine proteinase inhibitor [Actinomadura rubrisoli]|nr:SSI family serine proteinase inhibitor [Actinomadura rubrisoli]